MPAILIRLNSSYASENLFTTQGIIEFEDSIFAGFFGRCVHLCCIPAWHKGQPEDLEERSPDGSLEKYPWIYCACHGSRYDPFDIVNAESPESGGKYKGAAVRSPPAPRPLPQILLDIDGEGKIIGLEDNLQWYDYC